MGKEHSYKLSVSWTGNKGQGTLDYRSYERSHLIKVQGKPDLQGSADPLFRGDASKWNPEELLLGSLSSCHMLWYLHLCSMRKIVVTEYQDHPTAILEVEPSGDGKIKEATLYPQVSITAAEMVDEAMLLHEEAHKKCFIAKALNFPVKLSPSVS